MGQIAGRDLITLTKGLKTTFFKAYEEAPAIWPKVATLVESNSDSETYGWLGSAPTMREWTDERVPKGLSQFTYTIRNKHYEASIGVNRDDLDDDQYGQINVRVADMGMRAKMHPDELISALRIAGTAALCYDGQYFYDNDHSEGSSGSQDNLLGGDGVAIANVKADFIEARAAIRGFLDDRGKPFHRVCLQFAFIAPPELEGVMEEFLKAPIISQTSNIFVGAAELIIDPNLTDANDWYLDVVNGYIKPFIYQSRKNVEFDSLEKETETGFMRNHFVYGVDYRANVGYGLWQNSVKIVNG
jgi:phage major head subunit gpT-like protein